MYKKWLLVLVLSLSCVACSNSKLVLRPLYNSLDNRFEKRFLEYADFDDAQTQQIKELADHFHVWHRQTQLENYSQLLVEFTGRLKDTKSVNATDISQWSDRIRTLASDIGTCNPVYQSADILSGLTDQQISQIRDNRQALRESRRQRRDADARDLDQILAESVSERIKQITRYLRVVNFSLNKAQLDDLRQTMNSTIRPTTSFRKQRDNLEAEFYTLLEKRGDENFKTLLTAYLDKRRQAFFDRRMETREQNSEIWEAYALRTVHSLDSTQREVAKNYLNGLASTINTLAADSPSYNKRTAAEYACLGRRMVF